MLWSVPFAGLARRAVWLRVVLLAACLLGMLASAPLWGNSRLYPLVPVADWFPALPAPWDKFIFGAVLLSLVLSVWFHRPTILFFLTGSLWLVLGDQNRCQPWFYLYWVMLAFTLLPAATAQAAMRFAVSAAYVWSGLQKCNGGFYETVVPFFLQPMTTWLPAVVWPVAKAALAATPVIEVFIGLGLWIPFCRHPAIVTTVAVHVVALLVLGPLGHRHNFIVWPWNVAMPLFVLILFPPVRLAAAWHELRHSTAGTVATVLLCLLPVLSFAGWWDSYLSFSLYSGNLAKADMFVSVALAERLPPHIQKMLNPMTDRYDPERQGPWVVNYQGWAVLHLGVPPLPEPRSYRAVGRYLAGFAPTTNDFHLIIVSRDGTTNFYNGGNLR